MALTGKLLADFSDFQSAVAKADLSLKGFETGAGKVGTALNKMGDSFSGRKVIQDAELATKAIVDIGGATKLTENEQARLNAQLTEAIAKYAALGQTAPPAMVQLANDTKKVEKEMEGIPPKTVNILGGLSKIAGAIGIGFSVGAVIGFGKSVLDTASHINDLSAQMGISTDAVQGFKFAAEQSGSSLDVVGTAITKMNTNLSEGDKSTVIALKDAGLSFQQISQMRPEEAFLAITDAIQKIPDPMKQAELAVKLFGKTGAELLPAIKGGMRDVASGAYKMSADTIKALDDAGDAWQALYDKVVIATGGLIAETTHMVNGVTSNWKQFLVNASQFGIAIAGTIAAAQDQVKNLAPHEDINLSVATHRLTKEQQDAAEKQAQAIKDIAAAFVPLTAAQEASIARWREMNVSTSTMAKALGVSEAAIDRYADSLKRAEDNASDFTKLQAELARASSKLTTDVLTKHTQDSEKAARATTDVLSDQLRALIEYSQKNQDLSRTSTQRELANIERVRQARLASLETSGSTGPLLEKAKAEINAFYDHQVDLVNRTSSTIVERMRAAGVQTQADLNKTAGQAIVAYNQMKDSGEFSAKAVKEAHDKAQKAIRSALGLTTTSWQESVATLSQSLAQLSQIAGGTFGAMARDLATLVGAADAGVKSFTTLKDGLANWKKGSTFEGIVGMTSGILGMVSAAISAGKALFDLFDRNKGRDLVVDFAKTMGGFDALHERLLMLGAEGEQLWIKLTQGVGRNNPQQAQAAIDAITRALDKQEHQQDESKAATEEQAQATIETATEAAKALEEIGGKLEINADQWKEWGRIVTAELQAVADAVRSIPSNAVPSGGTAAIEGFASGTHGQYLDFGRGQLAVLHGHERVMTEGESDVPGGHFTIQAADLPKFLRGEIVTVTRADAKRGGLRTRSASGRGY